MSLFRWFRRKEDAPPPGKTLALAMVLLPPGGHVPAEKVLQRIGEAGSKGPSLTDVSIENDVVTGSLPGGAFGYAHVPVRIPAADLEGPIAVAWQWQGAREEISRHESHVIVHATSTKLSSVDLRLFHTRLVAAIAELSGAIGVYVGGAMLVRSARDYVADAMTASRDELPLLCWIGINPVMEEDGTASGYTTGLTDFGFLELEIRRSSHSGPEVLATLADAAGYQISSGKHLGDGETFGFSASDRRKIRHVPSAFIPDLTVATMEW